jgi:hypothetical protein
MKLSELQAAACVFSLQTADTAEVSAVVGSKRRILAELINPSAFDAPIQHLLDQLGNVTRFCSTSSLKLELPKFLLHVNLHRYF